jgi:hypothetical protein
MRHKNVDRVPELVPERVEMADFDATLLEYARQLPATPGLSAHVRQLRNRSQNISRWLVLAIFAGVVVALAMVQYAVR